MLKITKKALKSEWSDSFQRLPSAPPTTIIRERQKDILTCRAIATLQQEEEKQDHAVATLQQ